jgi:SPP1 family predicted phage head-tail adaptor
MDLYPNIKAGKLRFPIQLVSRSTVQDAAGGVAPADAVPFATVWANIEGVSQAEVYEALQMTAQVTHKVTIRYLPGVKANMDVVFSNGASPDVTRVFTIIAVVNPDERPHVLYLMCLERDDSAYTVAGQ